jgi:MOSC domain-containing protein YiiM
MLIFTLVRKASMAKNPFVKTKGVFLMKINIDEVSVIGNPKIISLAIGKAKKHIWENSEELSAIDKVRVKEANLRFEGFLGDGVANIEFHGGKDRAVCIYAFENYAVWEKEFNLKLKLPSFGENITMEGMEEKDVFIGDIYRIGEAIVQVSQGRIPCSTISKFNNEKKLLNRVYTTGLTGYFCRVLEEGRIEEAAQVQLLEPNEKRISVQYANEVLFHDIQNIKAVEKVLEVDSLAQVWKDKLYKALAR